MMYFNFFSLSKAVLPFLISFAFKLFFREYVLKDLIEFTSSNEKSWDSVLIMTLIVAGCQYLVTAGLSVGDSLSLMEGSKMIQEFQMKVLKKSLRVNLGIQEKFTRSKVSQMINQECKKLDLYYFNLAFIIVMPIQFLHSIFTLYKNLGWYWIIVAFSQLVVFVVSYKLSKYTLIYRKKGQEQTQLRSSLVQSASESMRLIKGQNYEDVFYNKLDEVRERELNFIDKMAEVINIKHYLVKFSQPITMTVILLYYVFIDVQPIDITLIFALDQSFWAIRQGLGQYPKFLSSFVDQKIVLKQISEFFKLQEIDNSQFTSNSSKILLSLKNSDQNKTENNLESSSTELLSKGKEERVKLNLDIQLGDVIVVKGPTGSGKSYLLKTLLGEFGGIIESERKISYVGQDNWLQNKSIKENIILDREYDDELFKLVVKCFELDKDFTDFDYVITSSIDNISGGQRQRMNLARAFYSTNSRLILLDDSFCSLDRRVLKQIVINIFTYFRKSRNIIFAVNENAILEKNADILIEISQDHQIATVQKQKQDKNILIIDDGERENIIAEDSKLNTLKKPLGKRLIEYKIDPIVLDSALTKKKSQQEQGFSYFVICIKKYISIDKTIGVYLLLALVSISLYSVFYFGENYILMNWNILNISQNTKIFIFLGLGVLDNLVQSFRIYFSKKQGLYASKRIHKLASSSLLNANYQLYLQETITPHKFQDMLTTQIQGIDFDLSTDFTRIFFQTFQILNAIVLTLWGSLDDPVTLIGMAIFLYQGIQIAQQRISNQQQIQVMIKETNQPIIGYVNECLAGLEYIRVYEMEKYILDNFKYLQQKNQEWTHLAHKRALFIDLKFSSLTFVLNFVAMFSCLYGSNPRTSIPKATSNSQIDLNTLQGVKCFNNIFVQLVSFSYVIDFLQQINSFEPNQKNTRRKTDTNVGNSDKKELKGEIEFVDYTAFYTSEKDQNKAALKHMNIKLKSGEKVCVVGRTGSGKTSLILSTLNLIHYENGKILFDGQEMDGYNIRDNVSVIQQENIVMKGTLKENIDPLNLFDSEQALQEQIQKLNLGSIMEQNNMTLSMKIEEQGKNLSAGSKQIVSLVRALIQNKNIILFDEANSNLDENNENLMQQILLERKSTMIFIAHKIKHINQFDRVLYLENGLVVEDGSPNELLSNQESKFYKLYYSKS